MHGKCLGIYQTSVLAKARAGLYVETVGIVVKHVNCAAIMYNFLWC